MQRLTVKEATKMQAVSGHVCMVVAGADGRKYYAFDTKLFPLLKPGAELEVETKQGSRGFLHITAAKPVPQGPGKDDLIAKEVALKAAADIVVAQINQGVELDPRVTIEYAQAFVDWLLRPLEPEPEPEPIPEEEVY